MGQGTQGTMPQESWPKLTFRWPFQPCGDTTLPPPANLLGCAPYYIPHRFSVYYYMCKHTYCMSRGVAEEVHTLKRVVSLDKDIHAVFFSIHLAAPCVVGSQDWERYSQWPLWFFPVVFLSINLFVKSTLIMPVCILFCSCLHTFNMFIIW